MPPPPPPPPPPGPPPPPAPPPSGFSASASKSAPADRNALLAEIRTGTRLKKAVTNDKSAPMIDGKSRVSNGSGGGGSAPQPKLNGPSPGPMMMGNIFAHGMPKLRQTGNRPVGAFSASRSENSEVSSTKNEPSESLDGSNSKLNTTQTASPNLVLPPPFLSTNNGNSTSQDVAKPQLPGSRRPSFPNDVVMKGPPPAPPPASQKPNFSSLNDGTSLSPAGHQRNRSGPLLPNKPPGGVARSNSQTNLGPKKPRPPPSVKPPPPPKSPSTVKNGPPAPPSKPPSITRRQSLGSHDIKNGILPNQLSTHMEVPIITPSKLNVPAPPPRNFSAPNSLNQLHTSGGSPHPPSLLATNRSAPPPPPPPPPQSAKSSIGVSRSSSVRPPPPPPPPVPPGASSSAPPPPPHRSPYPAPPSQMKAVPQSVPPPPPLRNASTRQGSAVANQLQRRNPPPLPPGGTTGSQPDLHIQLDSKMFPSNTAQC